MTNSLFKNPKLWVVFLAIGTFIGCGDTNTATKAAEKTAAAAEKPAKPLSKPLQLINKMEEVNGGWNSLLALKDVQYDYRSVSYTHLTLPTIYSV